MSDDLHLACTELVLCNYNLVSKSDGYDFYAVGFFYMLYS